MAARSRRIPAQSVFFPAAICHALVVIPLSVLANTGAEASLPGLVGSGHAREMLSGFALALVAGYTLGLVQRTKVILLLGIWLLGRIATLSGLFPLLATISTLAFGALLAAEVIPRFMPARRWRNRAQIPLLGMVSLLPGVWALSQQTGSPSPSFNVLAETTGILLLTLLMLFMGGGLIAPAAAGDFYERGGNLENRVQPRIEGALLLVIPLGISCFLLGGTAEAGVLLAAGGTLAAIRLWRWQLWRCRGRTDLHGLGIGYGWLIIGLLLVGISMLAGRFQPVLLHTITIGALGTLSIGVMARWYFQQDGHRLPSSQYVIATASAVAIATLARIAAIFPNGRTNLLLWVSVAGWEVAYLLAVSLALKLLIRRRSGRSVHVSVADRHGPG